jgi:hypothetical protein
VNRELLRRPFPSEHVKTRPGQHGKTLSYVDVSTVLQRLHEACDVLSFEVVRHEVLEDEVIVVGRLSADGIVNVDFGCSSITRDSAGLPVSIGDDLKAASSDAIKRCARLLGCPLDLHTHADRTNGVRPNGASPAQREPSAPAERLTARQLAAIQSVCRRQNIGRDELVAMIEKRTHKNGLQFLTKGEASALLDELANNGNGAHA